MAVVRQKGKRKKKAGRNVGPARDRYWNENRLEKHKVRNLMRCSGMTRAEATKYWREARVGRMR